MVTKPQKYPHYFLFIFLILNVQCIYSQLIFSPAHNGHNINPDTHLEISFLTKPKLGTSGQIRIYDLSNNQLIDLLDMSIPAGPTIKSTDPKPDYIKSPYQYLPGKFTNANTKPGTASGGALPNSTNYQLTIIGGFTDGFHFYPVIIHDNTATIYPHNNLLDYNKTYYVQIDTGVLITDNNSFRGISGKDGWVFTTKKTPPSSDASRLIVSADGSGDFNTVQGAMDFIPDYNTVPTSVFIKNGVYEEIVYFRNKSNVSIEGQSREKVIVKYANKETFNPHPVNISTNEVEGTFPSRRAAFAVDHCTRIQLSKLTIESTERNAQAEGLLINGRETIVNNVTIIGSGDALQTNGSAYFRNCRIEGQGDVILGRGPGFFKDCEISSTGGAFMWIRNTIANHGNVFLNSKFEVTDGKETVIARAPTNSGKNYPYCEAVLLNCRLEGILPIAWGPIGGDSSKIHYWEYNSLGAKDGKPVSTEGRNPASRQLTMEKDSAIIKNYSNPAYVLDGWNPVLR